MCIDDCINYLYRHIANFDELPGAKELIEFSIKKHLKVLIKRFEELNKKSAGANHQHTGG